MNDEVRKSEVYMLKLLAVKRRLSDIAFVLIGAWLFAFVSWFTSFCVNIDLSDWFSRSGAVLTVASLLATLSVESIKTDLIGEGGYASQIDLTVFSDTASYRSWAKRIANYSAIIGAIIWGYGDLIHAWVTVRV